MSFKHITSRDNPIFKQFKRLSENARERRKLGQTLLDGPHLLEAYLAQFGEPLTLVIAEGESTAEVNHLIQQLEHIHTLMLPTLMFAELTPVASPTGILALVPIPAVNLPEAPQFVLMLENIQDPGNLGSMLRTAAAAGVDAVYLSQGCTDAWSPKALRGGQGAQLVLPMLENADLVQLAQNFAGLTLATTLAGASLYTQDLRQPVAFAIGNEGAGLSARLIQACELQVTVPIVQGIESLNAAAAASICLFERVRQAGLPQ